jgi:ABC-type phosphate transport system substrate-binding protein
MRTMRTVATGLALALGMVAGATRLEAQSANMPFTVIVNENNPVNEFTREELSRMFLKKVTTWRTKRPVMPVDLKEGIKTRELFTRTIHRREVTSVASYWQQQIFAGRAVPPSQRASDADVMSYVAGNPDAIGYVASGTQLAAGVKAVAVR